MDEQVYQELGQKMIKRGGRYPGMDIPEFYDLIRELFTPEEAAVLIERQEISTPPIDQKALAEAVKKADRAG